MLTKKPSPRKRRKRRLEKRSLDDYIIEEALARKKVQVVIAHEIREG